MWDNKQTKNKIPKKINKQNKTKTNKQKENKQNKTTNKQTKQQTNKKQKQNQINKQTNLYFGKMRPRAAEFFLGCINISIWITFLSKSDILEIKGASCQQIL